MHKQKPRREAGVLCFSRLRSLAPVEEPLDERSVIVDAELDGLECQIGRFRSAAESIPVVAEIGIIVLDLRRPLRCELVFDTAADNPAEMIELRAVARRAREFLLRVSRARRSVEQRVAGDI